MSRSKPLPPMVYNYTGHVWTPRGLAAANTAAAKAAATGAPQSVRVEVLRGPAITVHIAPTGVATL